MYLFDTNILSDLVRKRPNERLRDKLSVIPATTQFTSCITVMELRYGSSRRPDHKAFWERIERELLSIVQVLPVTQEVALIAGDVAARMSLRGRGISPEDLLIGSTAIHAGLTLITANERHFADVEGLRVENWLK